MYLYIINNNKYITIKHYISVFFLFILISCNKSPNNSVIIKPIDKDWQFGELGINQRLNANVPGTIHTDLYFNNIVPDPFYGCNESNLQWIGEKDWQYTTTFSVDQELLANDVIELIFEGIDTYSDIVLNDNLLIQTDNMFRKWSINVKEHLLLGDNQLIINLYSPEKRTEIDSLESRLTLPGGKRVYARKAGYHFGWDWGPRYLTSGIWKPVYLKAWSHAKVDNTTLKTVSVSPEKATLSIGFELESKTAQIAELTVKSDNRTHLYKQFQTQLSQHSYQFTFDIENPVLWWCNGLGTPHLYDFIVEINTHSGLKYTEHINFGIRSIEVITESDTIGQSMYMKINGVPVFIKGANYIPQHSFVTSITTNDYERIIQQAKESNMNMLRVWGGGIYENIDFYRLCDKYGIMVWQDFMFACAMYPSDSQFISTTSIEVEEQIKRLRKHTSIALWCGNNEIDEGWHNWKWQKEHKISQPDSAAIWNGYKMLFQDIIPRLVAQHDSGRFYTSTSPLYGWGRTKSMTHGHAHYWGVWWGKQPFTKYLEKVPRFMTEYGFQSMPALSTIRTFQDLKDDTLFSPALQCHQKHKIGYQIISQYLEYEHLYPQTLDKYIYTSQLIQAEGIGMAIEAHRRSKPYCMGTLYWQLNDCWPVTSWSSIDFYGNKKMLQFKVKELYDSIMVSLLKYRNTVQLYVVSDILSNTKGVIELLAHDFNSHTKSIFKNTIDVKANSSQHIVSIDTANLFTEFDTRKTLFEARFTTEEKTYVNRKFFAPLGLLTLPQADYNRTITQDKTGFKITIEPKTIMAFVNISLSQAHGIFDKNHLILLPNETTEINLECKLEIDEIYRQLIINYLTNKLSHTCHNAIAQQ